jgi:multidrug efflux pump
MGGDGFRHHGGLLVAIVLTLISLPTLYVAWFGGKWASARAAAAKTADGATSA